MKDKTVLLVDDDEKILFLLSDALAEHGFTVITTAYPEEARPVVEDKRADAVLLDLVMPGMDGIEVLRTIKKLNPLIPVIMLSGHGTIEKAVKSVKMGAYDFLEKPISSDKVAVTLKNAISQAALEQDKHYLLGAVRDNFKMVGNSAAMNHLSGQIGKMAPSDSWVSITGESGTGKELVARALHLRSPRAAKPFVAINCAAIPEDLMEPELFGYEKGAFTGAFRSKPGLFEQAGGGTLFLDEISEMSPRLQSKLLRVLDGMEFQPVGGTAFKKVDVRIISATNKDLDLAVKERTFRQDLFYRVSVLSVNLPPLRDRKEDIPGLIDYFTGKICSRRKTPGISFHPQALDMLGTYHWPGNIRQLKNLVEKIVVMADERVISPEILRLYLDVDLEGGHMALPLSGQRTLEAARREAEKEALEKALQEMAWDYEKTAGLLGVSRATLFNKMKIHGVQGKGKS